MAVAAKRKPKVKEPARTPTVVDAMSDPTLFGSWYQGASWDGWKAVLRGAFGLEMTEEDVKFFRTVAERDPPQKPVKEIWVAAGRRSGKDSVASLIAAHAAATFDKQHLLRPGERALVLCLATDREQAKICLNYVRAFFTGIEMLKSMIQRETADGFELSNSVDVQVATASYRAVRGRAIALVVLDEISFFSSENSANPDLEIYRALLPGLATLNGTLVAISSPYRKNGLLHSKFKQNYGKDSDGILFIKAATRTLNPTIDQAIIDQAMLEDRAAASSEWMGEFRDDIGGYLALEMIEAAVDRGVIVRPPVLPINVYRAGCDPASGSGKDSFTAAVSHEENGVAYLDALLDIRPPFNPSEAVAQIAEILKSYGIKEITGDRYSAGFVVELFAVNGITYRHSERDRSAIYADAMPLFTSARARILDIPKLVSQFAGLERKTSPSGRDPIDHGPGGHDDSCNSVALALVLATAVARGPKLFFASIPTNRPSDQRSGFSPTGGTRFF
jgi:hypothetical protein